MVSPEKMNRCAFAGRFFCDITQSRRFIPCRGAFAPSRSESPAIQKFPEQPGPFGRASGSAFRRPLSSGCSSPAGVKRARPSAAPREPFSQGKQPPSGASLRCHASGFRTASGAGTPCRSSYCAFSMPKKRRALSPVSVHNSSVLMPSSEARHSAVNTVSAGSLVLPRQGCGAR